MEHFAGIDVSLEQSSVCVVDGAGKIMCEAKVTSEPEALGVLPRSGNWGDSDWDRSRTSVAMAVCRLGGGRVRGGAA
jgi:hypothetical protein